MLSSFTGRFGLSANISTGLTSPTQLPNLKAWYNIADLGLADGASISTVTDSSGNGYHLTGSGGIFTLSDPNFGGKPTLRGLVGNGFSYVRSYASGGFIQGNDVFAMYAVARIVSYVDQVQYGMFFGFGDNNTYGSAIFTRASYVAGSGGYYVDMVSAGAGGSYSSPLDVTYIFQYSYGGGDRGIYPFIQNNLPHSTGAVGGTLNIGPQQIKMGGKPGFGWSCIGTIAEVIVYKDYHDVPTMTKVRDYLNKKYLVF